MISASEDKNAKVFSHMGGSWTLTQSLPHPCSLWSCAGLPNGDIITGGSDGVVRVFTRSIARMAPDGVGTLTLPAFFRTFKSHDLHIFAPQLIQAYQLKLASQTVSSKMVGQIDATKLQGPESLNEPGVRPDQRKIINNKGVVEIYQWIASEYRWTKVLAQSELVI
jgi:phospholipase A-2-activating protein